MQDRVILHEDIETMEADFEDLTFSTVAQVDAFYDEADRRLAAAGKRWYFLINYTGCVIATEVWDRFAERGKRTNIQYSLGTVRVGTSVPAREAIRQRAQREMFRANIYETRDQAMLALGEMRKQRELVGGSRDAAPAAADAIVRVDDIHLSFGGVNAITGVGFGVNRGEITSIIGPNGAGKSSMLNVISGFYRATRGRIFFEGKDRTDLPAHAVARLGFARTFQNIALFKGMSTLDNIMTGRSLKIRSNFLTDALYWGFAQREENAQREFVEEKEDMVRFILDVNDQMGTTIILIEHDMGVVMDISHYVVVMDHGAKIAEGTPVEVKADPVVIRAYLGAH